MPPPTDWVRVNQVITDLVTRCHPGGFPLCGCCSYVTVDAVIITAGARLAVAGDVPRFVRQLTRTPSASPTTRHNE